MQVSCVMTHGGVGILGDTVAGVIHAPVNSPNNLIDSPRATSMESFLGSVIVLST